MKASKRYREIQQKIITNKRYSPSEALEFLQKESQEKSKNIEIAFSLRWKEKNPPLRTNLLLPYPVKPGPKIAVLTGKQEIPEPLKSQVELITLEELSARIKQKKTQWGFEKLLADLSLQEKLQPLAKILGPKKMFPTTKEGTLTEDLATAITENQKRKSEIKTDKQGNIHALLGQTYFSKEQLEANYQEIRQAINRLKPAN